ncbi:MAG: hypothetical protein J2P22_01580 [Nocardioides sp.]|nr:hypothetical protein [Nocardioides sp.]
MDGDLARMRALLSAEQDERVEQTVQAVRQGGYVDQDALRALIGECLRDADISQRVTTRAYLERNWHDVEESMGKISRKGHRSDEAGASDGE